MEPIGDLPAGQLLNYFVEEIGPVIYNKAVADAQARMLRRVDDLSGELYVVSFSTGRDWQPSGLRQSRSASA